VVSDSTEVLSAVEHLSSLIESLSNVKSVKIVKQPRIKTEIAINRSKVGAAFKKDTAAAVAALEKENKELIVAWLSGDEPGHKIGEMAFTRDMVSATETADGFSIAAFEEGKVFLKTEVKKELYEEAMVREVARRVQIMRKEKKLVEADRISLHMHTDSRDLAAIIKKHADAICAQVNAETLSFAKHASGKEWEIDESIVEISFEKK
jgi:hypothetical protein